MDFDPLADNAPPRYAIESDEEEDEYNPLNLTASNPNDNPSALSVRILGDLPKGKGLVIATGDGGKYWAKGANLGEQMGTVQANNMEVGLIFNPTWTHATVIVSEALTRLPVWAQHTYSLCIIEQLQPTRLALLDTYSAPSFVSSKPIPIQDAPIRYLSTTNEIDPLIVTHAKPFVPPNLIQSTSAAYLSIASTSNPINATLILLPSARIPRPPPATILPPDISHLPDDTDRWSTGIMSTSQQMLFVSVGEPGHAEWKITDAQGRLETPARKSQISDNGMYI
ncbi:hypothetical protein F5887DRAFT_1131225 [Amanita rubescens]|nr:hypothetical protein F5887DRAFT_1131225 [Amanita rubescens]